MAYVLYVQVRNPLNGQARDLTRQFDPAALTAGQWTGLRAAVAQLVADLQAETGQPEPPPL